MEKPRCNKTEGIKKVLNLLEAGRTTIEMHSYFCDRFRITTRTVDNYIKEAKEIHFNNQQALQIKLDKVSIDAKKKEREKGLYDIMDIKMKLMEHIDNEEIRPSDRLSAIDLYNKMIGGYSPVQLEVKEVRFEFDRHSE